MTEIEQLRQQVAAQTCDILRLRAEKAELALRVANLQRVYDAAQRHIGRLHAQLRRQKRGLADQVFGGK